jgi:hypothetical protein
MGLDVAGSELIVARMGVRAAFSNRLGYLGRWDSEHSEPVWRSSAGVLDTLVVGDLDPGDRVSVVLAVPGWFSSADRATVRCSLETEHHRIAVVVASATAAAVHAAANGLLASAEGHVVAVDVATGVSASLVSIDRNGVTEHGVGGIAPSTIGQADHLDAAVAAMIGGLLERCSVTGQHGGPMVTAAVIVTDEPQSLLTQRVRVVLAAAVAALWPPVDPVVVERGGSVAEGAVLLATIISAQGVLEVDLLVGSDGVLSPLPEASCVVEPGVPLVRTASSVSPIGPPPDASLPDPTVAAHSALADSSLEELARAEASAMSLGEALVCCERLVSREVGTDVAIRSVYDLLGCSDGAGVDTLRAAARQLEEAVSRRPAGDALAGAVNDALRAVRRSFADPAARRYFGGSRPEIEAELARVVEHVALVVGEVSSVERHRVAADARASGLPRERIEAMLTSMLGSLGTGDTVGAARPTVDAVVSVDPTDGHCVLTGVPLDGAVPIRVVVVQSDLVA